MIRIVRVKVLGGVLAGRGIRSRGKFSIRNCNLDADLRGAALRTKRPAIFDRSPALLARMIHYIEASAQRTGGQGTGIGSPETDPDDFRRHDSPINLPIDDPKF